MLKLKNSTSELEQLKELLLADELVQLKELASKLKSLDFESQDEETILKRVTPLFNTLLLERMQNKDGKTQEILATHLAGIISESSQHDLNGLSRSLQSVISPAISQEIANNKDTMIDALYPIMGGMISKYVTQAIKEMMETINKKIESGLSVENYKRKAKAKLTGVSETELLIEESGSASLSSMFVIHKETSLLIAEAHLESKEIDDPHMVASMASAIKDFINDWVETNQSQDEIQILSYGNATLYIESAGSVYVIAFFDSEPDYETRNDVNAFFASLMKEYSEFFQRFDGDDSAEEIVPLSMKMEDYIYERSSKHSYDVTENKPNIAKYILIGLTVALLGYGVYLFNGWYINYSLESAVEVQTGEKISVEREDESLVLTGQVSTVERISEIVTLIQRRSDLSIDNHLLVPMQYLDERIKSERNSDMESQQRVDEKFELLERNIEYRIKELTQKNSRLEKELQQSKSYLEGLVQRKTTELLGLKNEKKALQEIVKIKSKIYEHLDSTFKGNAFYVSSEHALDFGGLKLFDAGSVVYSKDAIMKFGAVFDKYISILTAYKEYIDVIIIEGHTDSSGIEEDNIALSKKRATSVKYYVERSSTVKQYHLQPFLKAVGYGSEQLILNGDGLENSEKSRRIKVKFELSDEKIVNKIKGILHD